MRVSSTIGRKTPAAFKQIGAFKDDCASLLPLSELGIQRYLQAYFGTNSAAAEQIFWQLAGTEAQQIWQAWRSQKRSWQEHAANLFKTYTQPNWENFWSTGKPRGWFWTSYYWSDLERQKLLQNSRSLLKLAANPCVLQALITVYEQQDSLPADLVALLTALSDVLIDTAAKADSTLDRQLLITQLSQLAWQLKISQHPTTPLNETEHYLDQTQIEFAQKAQLLIVDQGIVAFTHPLLLDFFAAHSLIAQRKNGLLAKVLWPTDHWWQSNLWDEVAKLALDLEPDPRAYLVWLIAAQPKLAYDLAQQANGFDGSLFLPYQSIWRQAISDIENYPNPHERQTLGLLLGLLHWDERYGISLDAAGLPEIDWVYIPAGEFIYQQTESISLASYRMSRYLVTNAQYQAFLQAADGYADKRWWQGLEKPAFIAFIQGQSSNRPATLIAWSEALAFCRWLSFKTGLDISLPTEQQWEQAARGTDGRIYPWGNRYQLGYANCIEVTRPDESLLESSVVGIYPQGASPDGLSDMSGNVAEWCLGELNDAWHIYRGGAFDSASEDVSCLERESDEDLYIENQGLESVGFRLCTSTPAKLSKD